MCSINENNMIRKTLQTAYIGVVGLAAFLVLLFETVIDGILVCEVYDTAEYVTETVGILLLIALLPLAAQLFSIPAVRRQVMTSHPRWERNYIRWSLLRLCLFAIPLLFHLILYYMFLSTTHSFCAVIAGLGLLYGWPTRVRMEEETSPSTDKSFLSEGR